MLRLAQAAPIVRGACALKDMANGAHRRLILEFRSGDAILFISGLTTPEVVSAIERP